MPSRTWDWEITELSGRLELEVAADGTPLNPLVPVDLDMWRDSGPTAVTAAAEVITAALPVTVGLLSGPRSPELLPLLDAVSVTVTDAPATPRRRVISRNPPGRDIVPVGDLLGEGSLDSAVGRLREAVERSPRAAIACGRLVRQTAALDTTGGLAAEASAYSMLLGGPEFRRWRDSRGEPRRIDPGPEPVLIDRSADRLVITLNVPERRNAFSTAVREALLEALTLAETDPSVKSVELRGAGPSFCSGGDLEEFGLASDLVAAYLVRMARAPWRVIDRIAPKVTVRAHGACVGAGTEMTAYAGRVVAEPGAFFQLPEVGMGLVPGAGGSVSVTRRVGRHRAAWLMLTGDRLPADTALAWGLVDEIGPA
ncbi:MAG: enoyl-CoA hydratase/isomerase family protein [Streptosporangiales bacterium]|nr:enoyl-CoA hydratase/isomerase family protein [Streptosporangiales bacterium]